MKNLFALVDCNNFYASCERLFKPDLRYRPVVALSNNDGCIIARSNEAKALGISMGDPYFKKKVFLRKYGVQVFSSNYALYGDLSFRVMSILQQEELEVEVYSIDESFIRLTSQHSRSMTEQGLYLKERVGRCVGIPCLSGSVAPRHWPRLPPRLPRNFLGIMEWLTWKAAPAKRKCWPVSR